MGKKKTYCGGHGRQHKKVKPKRKVTPKKNASKKPTRNRQTPKRNTETLTSLNERVQICVDKVNELVENTNNAIMKLCDVLDEHDKAIKHIIGSQSTMQDSIKSVVTEINNLIGKPITKKEGNDEK